MTRSPQCLFLSCQLQGYTPTFLSGSIKWLERPQRTLLNQMTWKASANPAQSNDSIEQPSHYLAQSNDSNGLSKPCSIKWLDWTTYSLSGSIKWLEWPPQTMHNQMTWLNNILILVSYLPAQSKWAQVSDTPYIAQLNESTDYFRLKIHVMWVSISITSPTTTEMNVEDYLTKQFPNHIFRHESRWWVCRPRDERLDTLPFPFNGFNAPPSWPLPPRPLMVE